MSLATRPFDGPEPLSPRCAAVAERIQRALDGAPADWAAEPHLAECPLCAGRVRALHKLLGALTQPRPAAVPAGFADRVLAALGPAPAPAPRRARARVAALAVLAAALLVGAYFGFSALRAPRAPEPANPGHLVRHAPARAPELAPGPREKPLRIGDAVASAGQSLLEAPRPLGESVAVAPKLLDALAGPIAWPAARPVDPVAHVIEPARRSLLELPTAARATLEPVTGTAAKAYARFLRDLGSVKPNS